MTPRLAIVVLNYNGLDDTVECLESLYRSDYQDFKVFLVDNGSREFPAGDLRTSYPGLVIVELPCNMGFAGGNNVVLDPVCLSGRFDYVLLLNNDTIIKKDTLSRLVMAGEDDPWAGIIGGLILYHNSGGIWYNGAHINPWTCISQHDQDLKNTSRFDTGYVSGCCMLIKCQVLVEYGSLCKDYFTYLEDVDYCRRVRPRWRIIVDQDAVLYHKVSRTSDRLQDHQYYYYLRNRLLYMLKNAGPLQLAFFIPYYFIRLFGASLLKSLAAGDTRRAVLAIRAAIGGLHV